MPYLLKKIAMTATLDTAAVARYLTDNPQFFVQHAALLGEIKLSSPLTGKTVSLQERQMEVMRDKYKALEVQLATLAAVARENAAIANRFHGWTQALLQARNEADLPRALLDALCAQFAVPQATVRLWGLAPQHAQAWFARDVSDDARLFASSLLTPYCGSNKDFAAVRWLGDAAAVQSTAIVPLRSAGAGAAFGLLILGAPDPRRFDAGMATDFLAHIGATASAALALLRA